MIRFPVTVLVLSAVLLSGCATMVNGSRQRIMLNSSPDDANIVVKGASVGRTPWMGEVDRAVSLQVTLTKSGFKDQPLELTTRTSGWISGNVLSGFLCPLGSTTDVSSGGIYEYEPGAYHVALEPLASTKVSGAGATATPTPAVTAPTAVATPVAAAPAAAPAAAAAAPVVVAPAAPVQRQDALIKRFVLANFKDLGYDLSSGSGEKLGMLKGMMGYESESTKDFALRIRPQFTNAKSADDFAERLIRLARPAK